MLQYIEAPSRERPRARSVFLGGGITNCPDWQAEAVSYLSGARRSVAVYNPRRQHFPLDDPEAGREQIEWEFARLRLANVASFWFSGGSLNPIVLFEFGAALERDLQHVVVGVDPQYERILDIQIQTELRRPDLEIVYDLRSFVSEIGKCLKLF